MFLTKEYEECNMILSEEVKDDHVQEEFDRKSWFHDIREYLEKGEYPENATHTKKRTLWRLVNHFFWSGGILFRRTDLGM